MTDCSRPPRSFIVQERTHPFDTGVTPPAIRTAFGGSRTFSRVQGFERHHLRAAIGSKILQIVCFRSKDVRAVLLA